MSKADLQQPEEVGADLDIDRPSPVSGKRAIRGNVWLITIALQIFTVFVMLWLALLIVTSFSTKGFLGPNFISTLGVVNFEDMAPNFAGMNWQVYSEVSLKSDHPDLWPAKLLSLLAIIFRFATYFAMAIIVFIVAGYFRAAKPFAKVVRVGLMVISGGLALIAIVVPWFLKRSDQFFVEVMQLPTHGVLEDLSAEDPICIVCEWVSYPYHDFFNNTDWLLLALAVVLAFVAATYRQGEKLSRDTEGLV
ncbi:MAG: hypothetical protein WBA28_03480 [Microbacteriaceae bacterium]